MGGPSSDLATDISGQFVVPNPVPASYKFSAEYSGSKCRDALTGVIINFPMIQDVPLTDATTITAISLMTGPARSDPVVIQMVQVRHSTADIEEPSGIEEPCLSSWQAAELTDP